MKASFENRLNFLLKSFLLSNNLLLISTNPPQIIPFSTPHIAMPHYTKMILEIPKGAIQINKSIFAELFLMKTEESTFAIISNSQ